MGLNKLNPDQMKIYMKGVADGVLGLDNQQELRNAGVNEELIKELAGDSYYDPTEGGQLPGEKGLSKYNPKATKNSLDALKESYALAKKGDRDGALLTLIENGLYLPTPKNTASISIGGIIALVIITIAAWSCGGDKEDDVNVSVIKLNLTPFMDEIKTILNNIENKIGNLEKNLKQLEAKINTALDKIGELKEQQKNNYENIKEDLRIIIEGLNLLNLTASEIYNKLE